MLFLLLCYFYCYVIWAATWIVVLRVSVFSSIARKRLALSLHPVQFGCKETIAVVERLVNHSSV